MTDKLIHGYTVIGTKRCLGCGHAIYRSREIPETPDYCMGCWDSHEQEKEATRACNIGLSIALCPEHAFFDGAW